MKFHTWILLMLSSILFYSCSTIPVPQEPTEPVIIEAPPVVIEDPGLPSQGSEPIGPTYNLPNMKKVFTVKIDDVNYSKYAGAKAKLDKAEIIIRKIANSKEYKEAVLNFNYNGKKTFFDNDGLTNKEIYEKLFKGAESLMPAVNYQMDLKVSMYYKAGSTVGYTYPSDMIVHSNWKFHQNYEPCRIASNLFHEWTHKMGFSHSSKYTKARDYTVPYGHNDIIESLCAKAEKGQLTEL